GEPPQVLQADALDELGNSVTTGNLIYRGNNATSYQYNLEFGDSAAMAKLKSRRLQQFRFGGRRLMEPVGPVPLMRSLAPAVFMHEVIARPEAYDFVFAPFSNNDHNGQWDSYAQDVEDANK